MTRTSSLLCLLLLLSAITKPTARAEEQVLFPFDDESIPWKHNLHVTLVQGEKHPENPVVRCGPEGSADFGHAVLYGTVQYDGKKFRMWYLGMIQRKIEKYQAPGWWRPMCYAESTDGIHWTKPDLGLVDLNGNKKNNICLIEGDPHSLTRVNDYLTVLYEPNDPDPERRYKCAYIAHLPFEEVRGGRSAVGQNESRWGAFVCATSADGLKWKVVGDRPMNSGGERFEVSGLYRFGNFYYATGQLITPWAWHMDGSPIGRVMLAYRSSDFNNWDQAKATSFMRATQLTMPEKPMEGSQTHMGAGVWNRGNVLVGFYGMWQHGPKERPKDKNYFWGMRMSLGMVVSNDGVKFREPVTDFAMIPRGVEGKDWDCISLLQGHAFANVGDKTYVWYSHWDSEGQFRNMEIGLAMWRRDGFGYMTPHAPAGVAHCLTKTMVASSESQPVHINAAGVSPEAPITVELLDDRDKPLPDYSGENAAVVSTDSLHGTVTWPKMKSNELPKGKAVTLRVNFPANDKAKMYALYVGHAKEAAA
ncbi:MAG TPA: hypothetical protein VLE43_13170, partial [Candidatus Saccharimonadia bacterium]|nr:hypothetical protein [Candidatus Saccharimonadia bacterium]